MKLRTRLAVSFLTITLLPLILAFLAFWGLSEYQTRALEKIYDMTGQVELLDGNSVQLWNKMTQGVQRQIRRELIKDPDRFQDERYQNAVNQELLDKHSYMILRKMMRLFSAEVNRETRFMRIFRNMPETLRTVRKTVFIWAVIYSIW